MQASTMSSAQLCQTQIKNTMKRWLLSNPFMTNSSMVQMHRFMGYQLFISEQMNTMAAEKAIVAMSMTLSNTLKEKAIPLVSGALSVRNEGALLLIGTEQKLISGVLAGNDQMKPLLRELRLSTSQMCRLIVSQVEIIAKLVMVIMLTMKLNIIVGHQMISELVVVHYQKLLIQVLLVVGTQFGMTISTFMRQV